MTGERWLTAVLSALLIAAGSLAWTFHMRPQLEVHAQELAALPTHLQQWQGLELPIRSGIAEMLDADFNVQRVYRHPAGATVWLYVGYYGTEKGGRPEHTPWVCYPSNGWEIVEREALTVDSELGARVNELVVEKDGERRLVHFWYQSSRRTGMLGGVDQALDRIWGRVRDGRADGSLIRLSTPLEGHKRSSARTRLTSFGRLLHPLLEEHWPNEIANTS